MIRINLLPFRADRKKEDVRRQVSLFALSLALLLVVAIYYNFVLGSKVKKFNKRIKTTNSELTKYNEINKEIARIRENLENLRKKMAVIEQLESDRHAPVILLDTLTQIVVAKRMWLTTLTMAKAPVVRTKGNEPQPIPPTEIIIKGWALDDKTVADFMVRLQTSGLFNSEDVKLIGIFKPTEAQIKKDPQLENFKRFEFTCTKTPPQEPTPTNKRQPKRIKA
jgi:type IV pilus assembly protein PilN